MDTRYRNGKGRRKRLSANGGAGAVNGEEFGGRPRYRRTADEKKPAMEAGQLGSVRALSRQADADRSICGRPLTWLRYLARASAIFMASRAMLVRRISRRSFLPRCCASCLLPIGLVMKVSWLAPSARCWPRLPGAGD